MHSLGTQGSTEEERLNASGVRAAGEASSTYEEEAENEWALDAIDGMGSNAHVTLG